MFVRTTEHVPVEDAGPRAQGERGFEIRPRGGCAYRLDVWGRLRPGWADPLFRGLHRAGLSVERGFIRRSAASITEHEWTAAFQLHGTETSQDPVLLDYLSLLSRGRARSRVALALTGFELEPSPRHGGSLRLAITAPDRAGFLGGVLQRFSDVGVFSVETRIETEGGSVKDEFFLVTREGTSPGPEVAERIERAMRGRARAVSRDPSAGR